MSSPKIILLDIETSPNVIYAWGKYEQNAIDQLKGWELLSFAWKELGKGKTECMARPDFKDTTDEKLTREIWKIVDSADVVITQNGDRFDLPKLRAKFVAYKLPPPTPSKQIDVKKIAKAYFGFFSNSLNDIARDLGLGAKLDTGGWELWKKCIAGDPVAWDKMRRYNKHDVVLLEKVYLRLKAWYPNHPNFALFSGEGDNPECPVCESLRVQRRGYNVMKVRRSARYQCQKCGHWFSIALSKAEKK